MNIQTRQIEDGFIEITVNGVGITWAKNLEDVPTAAKELIEIHNKNATEDNS